VTGHDIKGNLPKDINLPALADPSATTIVFMGKRTFGQLQKKLASHGLPDDTPALLAEAVSTPQQQLTLTTIKELAQKLDKEISPQPALIFYGPLAEGYMDHEN
jgi:uroporphyrin-III C-methyltransferase